MEQKCDIHDYIAASCPRCFHRSYCYAKSDSGGSPETLADQGLSDICDFCGSQTISVPRVTGDCPCKRCEAINRLKEEAGQSVNHLRVCSCP